MEWLCHVVAHLPFSSISFVRPSVSPAQSASQLGMEASIRAGQRREQANDAQLRHTHQLKVGAANQVLDVHLLRSEEVVEADDLVGQCVARVSGDEEKNAGSRSKAAQQRVLAGLGRLRRDAAV